MKAVGVRAPPAAVAPAPASYAEPRGILNDVVARLGGHRSVQESGQRLSRGECARALALMKHLRDRHLKPSSIISAYSGLRRWRLSGRTKERYQRGNVHRRRVGRFRTGGSVKRLITER